VKGKLEGFETVKGPGHIYVLDRFCWLEVEARPEEQKNESKNKTKNKIKQNTKTGQEAIEKSKFKNGMPNQGNRTTEEEMEQKHCRQ